ncbi:unnamed protein product, partial [Iphiclides podalirius]
MTDLPCPPRPIGSVRPDAAARFDVIGTIGYIELLIFQRASLNVTRPVQALFSLHWLLIQHKEGGQPPQMMARGRSKRPLT